MKKKINRRFLLLAAIIIMVTAVSSTLLFYRILERQIFEDLRANAHVIVMRCLTEYYARSRTKARIWDTLPDLPSRHFLSERESWEKDGKE